MRGQFWLVAVLGALSIHCGSSSKTADGGSSDAGSTQSAQQACADTAHASCTQRNSCSNAYLDEKDYGDESVCETRTATECESNLMATGTAQTPSRIEACVAEYSSYSCTDFFDGNPPGACVPPAGSQAIGAACGVSAQCESTFCALPQYQVCGTCQTLPTPGAPCQAQADCGRDLACATPATASSGTCAVFVGSGGACLTGVKPCEAGLSCVGDDTTTMATGTCQAAIATTGAACDGSRKTMASCDGDSGLACIPTGSTSAVGTCQQIQLAASGACGDIGTPTTMVIACQAGGLCAKASTTDKSGLCVPAANDGAACDNDPTVGPPCLAPAKCVSSADGGTAGTCTVPNATLCQ